jgi:hypothetical protein
LRHEKVGRKMDEGRRKIGEGSRKESGRKMDKHVLRKPCEKHAITCFYLMFMFILLESISDPDNIRFI